MRRSGTRGRLSDGTESCTAGTERKRCGCESGAASEQERERSRSLSLSHSAERARLLSLSHSAERVDLKQMAARVSRLEQENAKLLGKLKNVLAGRGAGNHGTNRVLSLSKTPACATPTASAADNVGVGENKRTVVSLDGDTGTGIGPDTSLLVVPQA